jgi:glycosyltransferase involved in cell wall biosynthesis
VLEGYRRQARCPDELIVADDGSTSETSDVVERFRASASFPVRHVWQEDEGFRAARVRNEAVKACSGDYLIFTDGDCLPHPSFVSDHLLLRQEGCFVQGKRMLLNAEASREIEEYRGADLMARWFRGELTGGHHLVRIPGICARKRGLRGIKTCNLALFRRDVLAVNGFNEDFTGWGREDAEFAARLFSYGLSRKDPLFSATVLHLWHRENNRSELDRNDLMLKEAAGSSRYFCRNGLVKQ